MSYGIFLATGALATAALTAVMELSAGLGLTRLSLAYLLGSMFTSNRERARLGGLILHFMLGWLFALAYLGVFRGAGRANAVVGLLCGLVHAIVVLTILLPAMPTLHPRMASEQHGPNVVRQLAPPGFLGMHYGRGTPLVLLLAHLAFGVVLGALFLD